MAIQQARPISSTEQSFVQDQQAQQATRQGNLDLINTFFASPERRQEISARIDPVFDRARQDLGDQFSQRARQEGFARARSGNVGGSFEAEQLGGLNRAVGRAGTDLSAQESAARFGLEQQLGGQQQQEILQQFLQDPFRAQAFAAQLQGLGQQSQGAQVLDQLTQQQQQIQQFGNDELSRALGQFLNIGGQAFRADQINQAQFAPLQEVV